MGVRFLFLMFFISQLPIIKYHFKWNRPCRRQIRVLFFCISRINYLAINCFGHSRSMMLQLFFRWPHSAGTWRYLLIPDADPIPFLRPEEVANLLGHSTEFYDGSHAVEFCTVFFNGLLNKLATAAVLQSNGKRIQMRSQP